MYHKPGGFKNRNVFAQKSEIKVWVEWFPSETEGESGSGLSGGLLEVLTVLGLSIRHPDFRLHSHMALSLSVCLCAQISSFLRTTLLQWDLTLTLYICNGSFSK